MFDIVISGQAVPSTETSPMACGWYQLPASTSASVRSQCQTFDLNINPLGFLSSTECTSCASVCQPFSNLPALKQQGSLYSFSEAELLCQVPTCSTSKPSYTQIFINSFSTAALLSVFELVTVIFIGWLETSKRNYAMDVYDDAGILTSTANSLINAKFP